MISNYVYVRNFYASCHVPVAYYKNTEKEYITGLPENTNPYTYIYESFLDKGIFPDIITASDSGLYGIVKEKTGGGFFLLGPVYSSEITDDITRAFLNLSSQSTEILKETKIFLSTIPRYSYNQFLNMVRFLHLIINQEELSIFDNFSISKLNYETEITPRQVNASISAGYEQKVHGTYQFEQNMLSYVKKGNVDEIKKFLLSAVQSETLTEGRLADSPLRQAKNLFIGAVTIVGKSGAIPGGMDTEQVYSLIDTYIQECESLNSVDAVKNLQFNMLIDFTNRVAQSKMPKGISNDIYLCTQFISLHISEKININDVAAYIKKSRSYLTAKFRKETGKSVNEYILMSKLGEAKNLLTYSNKTITEISEYLCFSTQPYFSNVFRKYYGVTPKEYRDSHTKK